jgi:hypothetical protein
MMGIFHNQICIPLNYKDHINNILKNLLKQEKILNRNTYTVLRNSIISRICNYSKLVREKIYFLK